MKPKTSIHPSTASSFPDSQELEFELQLLRRESLKLQHVTGLHNFSTRRAPPSISCRPRKPFPCSRSLSVTKRGSHQKPETFFRRCTGATTCSMTMIRSKEKPTVVGNFQSQAFGSSSLDHQIDARSYLPVRSLGNDEGRITSPYYDDKKSCTLYSRSSPDQYWPSGHACITRLAKYQLFSNTPFPYHRQICPLGCTLKSSLPIHVGQ